MLGTRTSRPHPSDSTLFRISKRTAFFALRAQCGRDVRVPSNELTDFLGKAHCVRSLGQMKIFFTRASIDLNFFPVVQRRRRS